MSEWKCRVFTMGEVLLTFLGKSHDKQRELLLIHRRTVLIGSKLCSPYIISIDIPFLWKINDIARELLFHSNEFTSSIFLNFRELFRDTLSDSHDVRKRSFKKKRSGNRNRQKEETYKSTRRVAYFFFFFARITTSRAIFCNRVCCKCLYCTLHGIQNAR